MISNECVFCRKNHRAIKKVKEELTGISELRINGKAVLASDSLIIIAILKGYNTVALIKSAIDKEFYRGSIENKVLMGGHTEGNIRTRMRVLSDIGLVVANYPTKTARIPTYEVTNLGTACKELIMASVQLFRSACSDCIAEKSKVLGGMILVD